MSNPDNLSVEVTEVASLFPTHVWLTQLKQEDYTEINKSILQKVLEMRDDRPALKAGEKGPPPLPPNRRSNVRKRLFVSCGKPSKSCTL